MDFISLDFEIANSSMSSACSMGMVFVENNEIIDEKYFLIHPPTMDFDQRMVSVHGIRPIDVISAMNFNVIWKEIKHHFNDTLIVAHNAQFDMSVLYSCLTEYSLEYPNFGYIDSISISTKQCNGRVGNSLKERLEHFNIMIDNHHNALSDARAVAELVIKCVEIKKKKCLADYLKSYSTLYIKPFSQLKPQTEFKSIEARFGSRIAISEIAPTVETISVNNPFFGKNVVFTGDLQAIDRKAAMQEVVNLGGNVKSGVSGLTDYLVVGIQDKTLVGETGKSTKERKAYELIAKGKDIKIIGETEFLRLKKITH